MVNLDDFTSCVENGRCPPLNTSEHNTACCLPFSTEHHSQCCRSPGGCCLSRHLWCMVYSYTLSFR